MQRFIINDNEAGQRLDKYLKKLLKEAPAGFFYKMMRKKNIVLNGKKTEGSALLRQGDEVKLFLSDETIASFRGAAPQGRELEQKYPVTRLDILYEDRDLLVMNKPAGMLSQKARPEDVSANEYIIGYLLSSGQLTEEQLRTFVPSVCNRLDRNTSGLLIAGKSLAGLQRMGEQLRRRDMDKYYQCLVMGKLEGFGEWKGWLKKDPKANRVEILEQQVQGSSRIHTGYRTLQQFRSREGRAYTLAELHLITGRSHQLRAHLAAMGHPILGDSKYGGGQRQDPLARQLRLPGQLLHACRLEWPDGTILRAPLPEVFQRAVGELCLME
ncbi:MAG: RluA family pseudouridine synthase [Lachnospiraceae bacterium]|nr:RluA family pseudouridine synthase [Lachnospiraceae bacterium]MCI9150771.1 RluA family pseudouridine synthase [Lachnospiraceae bacterium]